MTAAEVHAGISDGPTRCVLALEEAALVCGNGRFCAHGLPPEVIAAVIGRSSGSEQWDGAQGRDLLPGSASSVVAIRP
jgi:hypothetical protein